jgi:hypothetical protein
VDIENDEDGELVNLRALARAVALQRQPECYVVYTDDEGKPIYDPFVRYGPLVVVLPQKLSNEQWIARFGHLADQGKQKHLAAATAKSASPPAAASATTERRTADASQGPERGATPVGLRRRSRFRP